MADEKKDEGVGDPIKILLKEALERQRKVMMEKFAQILQRLPRGDTSTSKNYSGSAKPFKVQVNFDIPIFEGQIDVDVVDKWLNLLEGYFSVHDFSSRETNTFSLLKAAPTSSTSGKPTVSRKMKVQTHYFQLHPLGTHSGMPSRSSTTLLRAMRINT